MIARPVYPEKVTHTWDKVTFHDLLVLQVQGGEVRSLPWQIWRTDFKFYSHQEKIISSSFGEWCT